MKLKDKVALVTGAGSGIGQATAVLFAREGAKVAVVDVREDAAKSTAEQIERAGGDALAIRADVAKAADIQAAVNQTLARWGRLDVFYANAGVPQRPTSVEEVDEATFDQIMAVNVKGVFLGAKYAAPVFKRQRSGVFLITGSTSAIRPRPGVQCYSASKGAVHTLAKSLALELAPFGARVVAIAPVATETPMLATFMGKQEVDEGGMTVIPLAADSLGVRSMATYVECGETRILIDPGASLGASRFNLPPSDEEWDALKRANDRISAYATRATVVFVSHYHEDHFRYDPAIYQDKNVWAKDPKRMVAPRQAGRAALLWKAIQGRCRLDAAEGRRLETPDAVLTASPPLSHGVDGTELGHVVALTVTDRREGTRFVHASDVQGPLSPVAAAYLIRERPNLLYLSGPPAYLESQIGSALIERGIASLLRIMEATGCRAILDHHALRAADYRDRLRRVC